MSQTTVGGFSSSHEIVELTEKYDAKAKMCIHSGTPLMKRSIEDDINKLFEAIGIGNSCRGGRIRHNLSKSAMKRPMRVGLSPASGIGISGPVSLKQALRGLCISQASEMAATKERMLRPSASPLISEKGTIKKLYGSVVVKASAVGQSQGEEKPNLMEIVLLPESSSSSVSDIFSEKNSGVTKAGEGLMRSREKGEISESSKNSIGEYSTATSSSQENCLSVPTRARTSKDPGWEAISSVRKQQGSLRWSDFKLLRKIGGGDNVVVYLCELMGTSCLFAAKVLDNETVMSRNNLMRTQTEKEIVEVLDHPFLPTLYAHFEMDRFLCLVMKYCPGGDLDVLRQKRQPDKRFSEKAARFYTAEVLLALEYIHMLGVVHRSLKPENILIQEDGHIMLSNFASALRCSVNPSLLKSPSSSPALEPPKKLSNPRLGSICINPSCLHRSWQLSCLPVVSKTRKLKAESATQVIPAPRLVVNPTSTQSNSFVGTHEYLAPEIIKGEDHGSAVDWWAFGIFLFELLYGKTPFKGSCDEETMSNILSQRLEFPHSPIVTHHARDLITRLLIKEPKYRLGSAEGASELKRHPFFDGLNWALIRHEMPPELPLASHVPP